MNFSIQAQARRFFLRGPILQTWVGRRARQWEQAYRRELIRTTRTPAVPLAPPKHTGALRRILVIADFLWEQDSLVPELRKIAEVKGLDLGTGLTTKPASQSAQENVAESIRSFAAGGSFAPDLILLYARPALLSEETFELLRNNWSCPILGMNLDDKFEFFPYQVFSGEVSNYARWARKFDLNLTSCLPATEWYAQLGAPCLYMPPGYRYDPALPARESSRFKHSVSFLGSIKPERQVVLREMQRAGLSIELFGKGWPGSRWVNDPAEVFRSSQINLGIGFASPSLSLTMVKARDFECPGAGGCYLTTYNWELANLFELGKEILCYRSVDEAIEMCAFYSKRPEECLRIGQAGWKRCREDHTWEARFRGVFRTMGLSVADHKMT